MTRVSGLFVVVTAFFVTSLIAANIIAVKLIDVFGLIVPAGVIIFPLSYIFGDVLTEVYGYARARRVIWLGFACNLLVVLAILAAQALPAAGFWDGQAAFDRVLGFAPRLLVASFLAYLVGEFANSYVLARLKLATRGRYLWLRTLGSTVIGQALDSAVFVTLAFIGTAPQTVLIQAVLSQWLIKAGYEAVATPFTYWVVNTLKRLEGVDHFDQGTDFNPFRLGAEAPAHQQSPSGSALG